MKEWQSQSKDGWNWYLKLFLQQEAKIVDRHQEATVTAFQEGEGDK
jgi:hypothetical protein